MTIGEIHDQLDWSQADKSLSGWNKQHSEEHMPMDADTLRRNRCLVIHNALTASQKERRQFCIKSLMGAGVWGQIEKILEANNESQDIRETDPDESGKTA